MVFMRGFHAFSIGMFILAFYQNWYWLYIVSRCLQVVAVQANSAYSNHMIRVADKLHKENSFIFNILCNDRSMNDIVIFIIGSEVIQYFSTDDMPILCACYVILGITCLNFLLTILQNMYMAKIVVNTKVGFCDFIKSDVPLSKKDIIENAIKHHNEDYDS